MSIMNYFESLGGVFVYEFAYSYNAKPWPMRRPENLLKELALILLHEGKSVGSTVSSMIHDCREYRISGVVLSYLITCRPLLFPVTEIRNALHAEMGMPVAVVEGTWSMKGPSRKDKCVQDSMRWARHCSERVQPLDKGYALRSSFRKIFIVGNYMGIPCNRNAWSRELNDFWEEP